MTVLSPTDTRKFLAGSQQFSCLDRHFAEFVFRLASGRSPELILAAALVSMRTRAGHTCLDLASLAGMPLTENSADATTTQPPATYPELPAWTARLTESGVVGEPGSHTPLIMESQGRLYLKRYWDYENSVADFIRSRVAAGPGKINRSLLAKELDRLFPAATGPETDWQKIAALAAVLNGLCIISGGPGTGKTSTVVKILALLASQSQPGENLRILLAAPTGKAAARLQEAMGRVGQELGGSTADHRITPAPAATLHRILGTIPDSPYFRHNRENPLPAEIVVVDEASMVDLPLMAKLMEAMPAAARLILLGDRDQLSSVEPGAVLGDICHPEFMGCFSEKFTKLLSEITGDRLASSAARPGAGAVPPPELSDLIIELDRNYRFRPDSGILALSRAVKKGDQTGAMAALTDENLLDISWSATPSPAELATKLARRLDRQPGTLAAETPAQAFAVLNRFRILSGLRHGPFGVKTLNRIIEQILTQRGLIKPEKGYGQPATAGDYRGRPVMITRNDYRLGLYNGDVGIMLNDPEKADRLRVYFQGPANDFRSISPGRLPSHETVYAMTVHKSQGSEFDSVLLILPDFESPVLTRELIYTAVTRAKKSVEIWGNREILAAALRTSVKRDSGLAAKLWGKKG